MRIFLAILAAWLLAVQPAAAQLMTLGAGPGGAAAGGGGGSLTCRDGGSFVASGTSGTHAFNTSGVTANDDIIISTVQASAGINFTFGSTPGSGTAIAQTGGNQSDGSFSTALFIGDVTSGALSNGNISYTGAFSGYDVSIYICSAGATTTATFVNYTTTAGSALDTTITVPGASPSVGSVGFVILAQGNAYNAANTVSGSVATWTWDVQNATPDSFFANYAGRSTNFGVGGTVLTIANTMHWAEWTVEITP